MACTNTDSGIRELDKLIHSFEFENQQYVKMIEKENQLISSLESQIQEKMEQTRRLEEEMSRFDEDTKRLHRLYTNNRDNIENLKNTIGVLSDHEVALSRHLEVTRTKTEDNRKFYKTQIANYSSVRDDYMKKYTSLPLAIELEKKKLDLAAAERKIDDIEAVKQDLKDRITTKENELDSKVMTRVVVKIAKTKLATYQLEKEIHECLAEKADLVEKLKEIRTSKQPDQSELCGEEYEKNGKLNMETSEMSSQHMDECQGQSASNEVDRLANMSISDDHHKSSTDDVKEYNSHCQVDELCRKKSEGRRCRGEISSTCQRGMHSKMSVDTSNVWDENEQQICESSDSPSGDEDLNSAPVAYHRDSNEMVADQFSTVFQMQTSNPQPAPIGNKSTQSTSTEDNVANTTLSSVSNTTSPLSRMKAVPLTPLNHKQVCQRSVQQSAQAEQCSLTPKQGNLQGLQQHKMSKVTVHTSQTSLLSLTTFEQTLAGRAVADISETPMPPSLRFPRLSVPKPPRVPPLPVFQVLPKLPEQQKPPERCTEIKKPPLPPSGVLDISHKLNQLLPRHLHHTSSQQNYLSTLPKTSAMTSSMAEEGQADHGPRSHQFRSTQVPQMQTPPSGSSIEAVLSKKGFSVTGHGTPLPANQQKSSTEAKKPTVGMQITSLQETVRIHSESAALSVSTSTEQKSDIEVPTSGCDIPATGSENFQALFKVNVKGSHSTSTDSKSPKRKYCKSPTQEKSSTSQGSHSLLESLFGNFEKNSNEDNSENYDEAAPVSIFSLFNISQNSGSANAGEDTAEAESFFTFGKFTEETGSPSSDGAPCSLLNLFAKSQNSESSTHEFAINLQRDRGEDEDKENEGPTFKLGGGEGRKESYFSYGRRCESDEEGDKPLFNLF